MTGIVPHTASAHTLSGSKRSADHRSAGSNLHSAGTLSGGTPSADHRIAVATQSAGSLYTGAVIPVTGQTVAVARISNTAAYKSSSLLAISDTATAALGSRTAYRSSFQLSSPATGFLGKDAVGLDKVAGGGGRAAVIRRPHSVDMGGLARRPDAASHHWLSVVPCKRIRPRECDELPDEFRRAGIGVCFEGTF